MDNETIEKIERIWQIFLIIFIAGLFLYAFHSCSSCKDRYGGNTYDYDDYIDSKIREEKRKEERQNREFIERWTIEQKKRQ